MQKARFSGNFRWVWCGLVALYLVCGASGVSHAAEARIIDVRVGKHQDYHRLVIEATQQLKYKIFTLDNAPRLVIDIPDVRWGIASNALQFPKNLLVRQVRYGTFRPGELRIVADLNGMVTTPNVFVISPSDATSHYRLVVDMALSSQPVILSDAPAAVPEQTSGVSGRVPVPEQKPNAVNVRDVPQAVEAAISRQAPAQAVAARRAADGTPLPVFKPKEGIVAPYLPKIVIDAGHGGVDPGAISRSGMREKEITLSYARALASALEKTGRFRTHLTRDTDVYLKLRQRIAIAKKVDGDLFISIHADSAPNSRARGLSAYTLSEDASDKEAELLAQRENKADIISGVDLSRESSDVTNILIDLAQRDTKNKSAEFADILVKTLDPNVQMAKNTHRYAGFAVLKAPDIPSVLLELGFLSNQYDARLLKQDAYQRTVVRGIVEAIDQYFRVYKARHADDAKE